MKQKLLISVRGPLEALEAARGGAHIADVEYPASALGTPYPLNLLTVCNRLNKAKYRNIEVSTLTFPVGSPASDYHPCFNYDGSKITYIGMVHGEGRDIHVMNSDGSNNVNITKSSGREFMYPQFQPRP